MFFSRVFEGCEQRMFFFKHLLFASREMWADVAMVGHANLQRGCLTVSGPSRGTLMLQQNERLVVKATQLVKPSRKARLGPCTAPRRVHVPTA